MLSLRAVSALAISFAAVAAPSQVVIGRLAEALKPTRIYASPTTHSRAYYRVPAYQYLVVNAASNGFVRVLLQNGSSGYAPESSVVELPYKVTSKTALSAPTSGTSRAGNAIANYGLSFRGAPYKWGGTDATNGIDCSGFVQKLYGDIAGVRLPRTAAEQALVGEPVTRLENLQPGDRLYFWEAKRHMIGHTGVYIGGGMFVHSSHGHGGVATDYLSEKWTRILCQARRGA
jgi:cell wall-associated NlpC family hydrolase